MIKRIMAVILKDLKSGMRDSLVIIVLVAPFIIILALKALIPSLSSTTIKMVVPDTMERAVVVHLEHYGRVETVKDMKSLEKRILKTDDIFGVVNEDGSLSIIEQGNEAKGSIELLKIVLDSYTNKGIESRINVEISDIGWKMSPLKQQGASLLIVLSTIFGGMLITLMLVEEKMNDTISAINVTPTSKTEFIIGKGFLGALVPLIMSVAAMLILGFGSINYGMLVLIVFCISIITLIIGFGIGIVNTEPIGAVASMKGIIVPGLGSVFGAIFLSEGWQFTMYWSPFYWAYRGIDAIILQTATWGQILLYSTIILAISILVFAGFSKRIKRGLN